MEVMLVNGGEREKDRGDERRSRSNELVKYLGKVRER